MHNMQGEDMHSILRLSRITLKSGFLAAVLVLTFGCDQFRDAPPSSPAQVVNKAPVPVTIDPSSLELFDGEMRKSTAFRLSGDLRPIWIVSGRIRNNSSSEVGSVTIRISINATSTQDQFDGATLAIDTDIPPGSVGSFSREIQIMPPAVPWGWSYDIVKVTAK